MNRFNFTYIIVLLLSFTFSLFAADKIQVVTTLTVYADIARTIGGDKVEVRAIVAGDQDAHYVKPKPSYAVWLSKADLFVETGLDLELWAPTLIDKSRNPKIRSGQPGYVAVADGVKMLEVPSAMDRSQGDVHIYGNPYIHTSPINAKIIAENIAIGLSKASPENADYFRENLQKFKQEIDRRLFGEELGQILGGETLTQLALSGQLISFLQSQSFQGKQLIEYLDGWMKEMLPLRGKKLVDYHENWVYFEKLFGVENLLQLMRKYQIKVILAANYFDERKVREIAEKIGGKAVIVPLSVDGVPEVQNYFQLIDYWVQHLKTAFQE